MAWHHSHKKQKDNLETQVFLLIFWLELKYLEWLYREYIKTAKNGSFCEELLGEIDFKAILANFCCYGYGANASEAVQKISTRTLELYANSLKQQIYSYTYEKTFSSLLPACWRYKPGFCFFPDINRNE